VKEFVQMGDEKQELVSCSVVVRTRDVFGRIYFVLGLVLGEVDLYVSNATRRPAAREFVLSFSGRSRSLASSEFLRSG
jgi:hypothetical protein